MEKTNWLPHKNCLLGTLHKETERRCRVCAESTLPRTTTSPKAAFVQIKIRHLVWVDMIAAHWPQLPDACAGHSLTALLSSGILMRPAFMNASASEDSTAPWLLSLLQFLAWPPFPIISQNFSCRCLIGFCSLHVPTRVAKVTFDLVFVFPH